MKKILFTRKAVLLFSIALAVAGLSAASLAHNPSERDGPYEVWILDQSDTRADGGGSSPRAVCAPSALIPARRCG